MHNILKNTFPQKGSISNILGYNTIFLGKPGTDFNMKIIFFGSYVMVYTGTTITLNRISMPSIALRESNEEGVHFFVSLYTGKEIHSNDWL